MSASTASTWMALAASAERLVAQLPTLSEANAKCMAADLSRQMDELSKMVMGRAEWETLLLGKQVGVPLLVQCDWLTHLQLH